MISNDFDICFDEPILPISTFPSYYQHALIGLCTSGQAKLIVFSKEHLLVKNELIVFVPGALISFVEVSSDFSIRYIYIKRLVSGYNEWYKGRVTTILHLSE